MVLERKGGRRWRRRGGDRSHENSWKKFFEREENRSSSWRGRVDIVPHKKKRGWLRSPGKFERNLAGQPLESSAKSEKEKSHGTANPHTIPSVRDQRTPGGGAPVKEEGFRKGVPKVAKNASSRSWGVREEHEGGKFRPPTDNSFVGGGNDRKETKGGLNSDRLCGCTKKAGR